MTNLLNESFKRKIEIVQYKAALVITGAIFHKIIQGLLPSHLHTYHNAVSEGAYLTRSAI